MRFNTIDWYLFFIGTLLITMSIVGGDSLNKQEVKRLIGTNKTVITVKDSHSSNDEVFFNLEDIQGLNQEVTFTAEASTEIGSTAVTVIGTSSTYPDFENMRFYSGCFFNSNAETGADQVVVIDQQLAWKLFGNLNVVGGTLELFKRKFKVIGVVAPDTSIIGSMSDWGIDHAYISYPALMALDPTARVTSLQILNHAAGLSGQNYTDALNILKQLGKKPEDYNISDVNTISILAAQKRYIVVFIVGLASIMALLSLVIRRGKAFFEYLYKLCCNEYLNNVLKKDMTKILRKSLSVVLPVLAIAWFWTSIRFSVYLPPECLSKQVIDFSFYQNLFKAMFHTVTLSTLPMDHTEIRSVAARLLSNSLFYTGSLIGFPVLWLSLKLTKWNDNIPLYRIILLLSLTFIGSVGVSAVVLSLAGIRLNLCITDLAVVFSFICIYTIKYSTYIREGVLM